MENHAETKVSMTANNQMMLVVEIGGEGGGILFMITKPNCTVLYSEKMNGEKNIASPFLSFPFLSNF